MSSPVTVKIINNSLNQLPAYATDGAAGADIRANIPEAVTLQTMERKLIPTGLFLEIPPGFEIQVRPRSGLAVKKGLTCLNSPGTVDSDYRGEIKVLIINLSGEAQQIEPNERIAQMVLTKVEQANFKAVQQLEATQRGEGGFGHTGTH